MTYSSYRVKVPGKLLIAGEYAILEPNQKAVVIAIDRYISAYIEPSHQNLLSLPQLGFDQVTWKMGTEKVQFNVTDPKLQFIENSLAVINQYLSEKSIDIQPFHLTIKSELDDQETGRKYGLGSSAAVVVAVISAILTLHSGQKFFPSFEDVFKLSAIAHLKTQKNGSGVDIAASTFGGWLCYSSFQPEWVLNQLQQIKVLSELVEKPWPNLSIIPLTAPTQLQLCVGWTGKAASTGPMIEKVQHFRSSNLESYKQFLTNTSAAVDNLLKSFELNDCDGAISSLTQSRQSLRMLSEKAGITIETDQLKALSQLAEKIGSGKSSGAGGGDCGIAFVKGESEKEELQIAWKNAGILPLKLAVSKDGVNVTEYNCEMSVNEYYCNV
ncbi:MAG TPA: phosphomevalonate kinase [Bacillales bacterium]|nr:phosphomevalonate kinase [Bacillales bacterium]